MGERVCLGEHGKEGFGEQRENVEFVATNRKGEDGDVCSARAEAVEENRRDFFDDGELRLWEFFGERGENAREQIRRNRWNCADGDRARDRVFLFDYVAAGGFQFAEDGAGARKKRFAYFGETNGTAETVEEAGAEFVFELEDLL